jgi:hypothetical protein
VSAVLNDGTKEYDHANDGEAMAIEKCQLALRNPSKNSVAKISYLDNVLKVRGQRYGARERARGDGKGDRQSARDRERRETDRDG